MKKVCNVSRGADPEVFLMSTKTKKLVSAIGKIGGTKQDPVDMGDGFWCQEDNVLAEFNIPPTGTKDDFVNNMLTGLQKLAERLPDGTELSIIPYGYFEKSELLDKKAAEFGCHPDLNCWTNDYNIAPEPTEDGLRTGGGHFHFGYTNPTPYVSQLIGQACDLFISVPSVLMSDEMPRRRLYGGMGSIRFQDYGVEYRTPSNFWIKNKSRIEWAYEQSRLAIEFVNQDQAISQEDYETMMMAIDYGEQGAARYLMDQYKINRAA